MKAITLWQPWATLVALGKKKIETRSWHPGYLGALAIHAATGQYGQALALISREPFRSAVGDNPMPRGSKVLAIVTVISFEQITADNAPPEPERSFGNYAPGRWCWRLGRPTILAEPIPVRGRQGLWEWNPPCQEPGCTGEGILCELYDDQKDQDVGWFYCSVHAAQNGFCSCCGNFYAGTSEMERWSGNGAWFCDNCEGDLGDDLEYDEEMDLWEHYPGELIVGNADYGIATEE